MAEGDASRSADTPPAEDAAGDVSRETDLGLVSRETSAAIALEPEPESAALVFGDRLELARQFAVDLGRFGEELGLIGPLEPARLWSRHLINCAVVAPPLPHSARVADVGSGAGLPGLVLALVRPDVRMTLIEPMERRTDWLLTESARLGLTNVTVLRARAEDAVDAGPFDLVTARAVSALSKLIPITAPLVRPGGQLVLMKGERVHEEIAKAQKVIQKHRLSDVEVIELGRDITPEVTRLFRATVGGAS